jgi:hypothetical protein
MFRRDTFSKERRFDVKPKPFSTRPPAPFKKEFLAEEKPPNFLQRNKHNQPFRDCEHEPLIKVLHEDDTLVFNVAYEENKVAIAANYVCNLGQSVRNEDIEDWMKEKPHLADISRKVLSEKSYQWLKDFLSGSYQMGKLDVITTMDPEIKAELQQFRLSKSIKAYRGIHFNINNIAKIQAMCVDKIQPHYFYQYKDDRVSSWTWNYKIAEHFAKQSNFNYILQHTFHPKDILIDCRLLHEYCNLRNTSHPNNLDFTYKEIQDEVIVLPGDYACEVKNAPFNKNSLLSTKNIPALRKLWDDFMKDIVVQPGTFRFGGNAMGLYGMTYRHIGGKVMYLLFDFMKDGKEYVCKYGILSTLATRQNKVDETIYFLPMPDESFYTRINKSMKWMKHEGDGYMDISLHVYKVGHEKCKEKCDKTYRSELYEVHTPYEMRSDSLMTLVERFIEDAKKWQQL